ncbi:MAG: hypothetical protein KA184_00325 [Candidatus Hydrogenedentes bacterium]|nr:hypothetical protein [Candidatus Hydrogenedentota bacterium]
MISGSRRLRGLFALWSVICTCGLFHSCGNPSAPAAGAAQPGTMQVITVTPATLSYEDRTLINNGDFREFWAGAPAPSGFHVVAPGGPSEIRRAPGDPAVGGSSFAALQTWQKPDIATSLENRFYTTVQGLKPETLYRVEALASGEAGVLAGLGVFELDQMGNVNEVAPCALTAPGGVGLKNSAGYFTTQMGGDAAVASLLVLASHMPAKMTWHAWRMQEVPQGSPEAQGVAARQTDRDTRRRHMDWQLRQIKEAINAYEGLDRWREQTAPFQQGLQETLDLLKDAGSDIMLGEDGYLFSRFNALYLLEKELVYQKEGTYFDACAAIIDFDRELDNRGIDLIFVPVPARAECFPDKLVPGTPPALNVAPQLAKFVMALSEMDVEVVELAESFRKYRERNELTYFRTDTRLSNRAVARVARILVGRLERYAFLQDPATPRTEYQTASKDVAWRGSLLDGLDKDKQQAYVDEVQSVVSVLDAAGQPFAPPPDSPILLAGDVARWYEQEGASMAAHLSKELRFPVSVLPVGDPGPGIPRKLAEQGADYLKGRRVLVWFVPTNYLRSSTAYTWESVPLP